MTGTRGLQPAVGQWEKPSRRATLESLAQSDLFLNRRSATKKLDETEPRAEAHHHVLAPRGAFISGSKSVFGQTHARGKKQSRATARPP